jgi:hypothetical protein
MQMLRMILRARATPEAKSQGAPRGTGNRGEMRRLRTLRCARATPEAKSQAAPRGTGNHGVMQMRMRMQIRSAMRSPAPTG